MKLLEANLGSCTASAFGYGSDADQNLLGDLAKKGSGNYAFVQNPDDALTAFGKELGGLLSTYATNLLINVSACADHEITDVISDVDSEEEKIGQGVRIKIPDILAEEVRHIVLGVKLKAQPAQAHKVVGVRPVNIFEVKAGWDVLDVNSKKDRKGAEAKAKVQFVKAGDEQKKPDAELDAIVNLSQVIRAQLEAEESAKRGDFAGAQHRMTLAANSAASRGHNHAQHLAHQVSARLGSAQAYADNGGYLRSVSSGVTRGLGTASYDSSASADLLANGVILTNSLQLTTSSAFAGGGGHSIVLDATVDPIAGAASIVSVNNPAFGGGIIAPLGAGMPLVGTSSLFVQDASVHPIVDFLSAAAAAVTPLADPVPAPPPLPRTDSKKKLSKKSQNRWK